MRLLILGCLGALLTEPASGTENTGGLKAEDVLSQADEQVFESRLLSLNSLERKRALKLLLTPLHSWEEIERVEEVFRPASGTSSLLQWIEAPPADTGLDDSLRFLALGPGPQPLKLKIEKTPCQYPLRPLDRCGRGLRLALAWPVGQSYREAELFSSNQVGQFQVQVLSSEGWPIFRRTLWARLEMLQRPGEQNRDHLAERLALVHHLPWADRASFRKRQMSAARLLSASESQ